MSEGGVAVKRCTKAVDDDAYQKMVDRAVEQLKREHEVASRDGRSRSDTSTPAPSQDSVENGSGDGEKMDTTQYSFNSGKNETDSNTNNGSQKENGNSEQSDQLSPKEQKIKNLEKIVCKLRKYNETLNQPELAISAESKSLEGELSADKYSSHVKEMEEKVLYSHNAVNKASESWLRRDNMLFSMSNDVDYDMHSYAQQLRALIAEKIEVLLNLSEKVSMICQQLPEEKLSKTKKKK